MQRLIDMTTLDTELHVLKHDLSDLLAEWVDRYAKQAKQPEELSKTEADVTALEAQWAAATPPLPHTKQQQRQQRNFSGRLLRISNQCTVHSAVWQKQWRDMLAVTGKLQSTTARVLAVCARGDE